MFPIAYGMRKKVTRAKHPDLFNISHMRKFLYTNKQTNKSKNGVES